jgi:hypothetical protein
MLYSAPPAFALDLPLCESEQSRHGWPRSGSAAALEAHPHHQQPALPLYLQYAPGELREFCGSLSLPLRFPNLDSPLFEVLNFKQWINHVSSFCVVRRVARLL